MRKVFPLAREQPSAVGPHGQSHQLSLCGLHHMTRLLKRRVSRYIQSQQVFIVCKKNVAQTLRFLLSLTFGLSLFLL